MTSIFIFSQTEIYFKYDEAGNQRYRGNNINGKQSENTTQQQVNKAPEKDGQEEEFWREVSVYPVPVKDVLTVQWSGKADELIDTVSMYQHSIVGWNFQQKNIPSLNRQVQIDMSGYYLGVYVLSFTLRDGKVYTKNILKQ